MKDYENLQAVTIVDYADAMLVIQWYPEGCSQFTFSKN